MCKIGLDGFLLLLLSRHFSSRLSGEELAINMVGKKILILSATGLAISVLLMGYATSVWQLFLLRFISGVFTGFVPMSQALISTQTPKETAGKVLGTLQTGSVTGTLMGPLL